MKSVLSVVIVSLLALVSCEKEEINRTYGKTHASIEKASPIIGNWHLMSIKYPGNNFYSPAPPNTYLNITETTWGQWATYVYDSSEYCTVTHPGPLVQSVHFVKVGNMLTLTYPDGDVWKLGKTN